MSYNLIAYIVFISIIAFIIVVVGKICFRNGNIFVAELIPGHLALCQQINKLLLLGYYLLNIGYAAMTLMGWETIDTPTLFVEVIAYKTAVIVCILSVLHYLNIFILTTRIQKLIQ